MNDKDKEIRRLKAKLNAHDKKNEVRKARRHYMQNRSHAKKFASEDLFKAYHSDIDKYRRQAPVDFAKLLNTLRKFGKVLGFRIKIERIRK